MVNNRHEVLITCHGHDWVGLANQVFLNAIVREDADVVVVGEHCIPATACGETFHRLSILELVVPLLDVFPFVEWLELNV